MTREYIPRYLISQTEYFGLESGESAMEYTVVGRLEGREEIREGVRASRVPLVVEDFRRRGADVTVRIDGTEVLAVEGPDSADY